MSATLSGQLRALSAGVPRTVSSMFQYHSSFSIDTVRELRVENVAVTRHEILYLSSSTTPGSVLKALEKFSV